MKGYAIGIQTALCLSDIELGKHEPHTGEEGGNTYMVNGNMLKLKDVGPYVKKAGGEEDKVLELG